MGTWILLAVVGALVLLALHDAFQKKHTIRRNFPIVGNLRYLLESFGPELRQYIVTGNNEERPFSRDQRSWIYASAKKQNNYFGFGTENDLEMSPNYVIVKHGAFPYPEPQPGDADFDPLHSIPCRKVLGEARGRRLAFRPESSVYISGMSFGSLSAPAVESMNRGAKIANCLHNTGEGGISVHHNHGAGIIWQIGTGYFGCRDEKGRFSLEHLVERLKTEPNVRAIEIKLSQGAKPGRGGVLPANKITAEIAQSRGIPMGQDCLSPAHHTAFSNVDELLDLVERIAEATGLPVGIKSAVGTSNFWTELAERMSASRVDGKLTRGVDFIAIDGGEGGTGAAPLVFADHVALPFKIGFARVYRIFEERGLADEIVFMGTGKNGFPQSALLAFALGCDMIGVAREAMMAIGCIQALRCHTGHCPAGVATQNKWLMRGLDPNDKSARMANYLVTLRKEIMWLVRAVGVAHPSQVTLDDFEVIDECFGTRDARDVFGYGPGPAPELKAVPTRETETA